MWHLPHDHLAPLIHYVHEKLTRPNSGAGPPLSPALLVHGAVDAAWVPVLESFFSGGVQQSSSGGGGDFACAKQTTILPAKLRLSVAEKMRALLLIREHGFRSAGLAPPPPLSTFSRGTPDDATRPNAAVHFTRNDLGRSGVSYERTLANDVPLREALATRGLVLNWTRCCDWGARSKLVDAMAAARYATVIVGMHGAGMMNCLWGREGALVLELGAVEKADNCAYNFCAQLLNGSYVHARLSGTAQVTVWAPIDGTWSVERERAAVAPPAADAVGPAAVETSVAAGFAARNVSRSSMSPALASTLATCIAALDAMMTVATPSAAQARDDALDHVRAACSCTSFEMTMDWVYARPRTSAGVGIWWDSWVDRKCELCDSSRQGALKWKPPVQTRGGSCSHPWGGTLWNKKG